MGHPINPQAFMHGISNNQVFEEKPFLDTFYCSQCGLCEMYSCMQGLSPATLIGEYRTGLRAMGVLPDKEKAEFSGISDKREYRKVPVSRLVRRLGLSRYNVAAPISDQEFTAKRLTISLQQNIGAPSVPVVKKGDKVTAGMLIANPPEGKLGVGLHAPMDGKVAELNDKVIIIEKTRK